MPSQKTYGRNSGKLRGKKHIGISGPKLLSSDFYKLQNRIINDRLQKDIARSNRLAIEIIKQRVDRRKKMIEELENKTKLIRQEIEEEKRKKEKLQKNKQRQNELQMEKYKMEELRMQKLRAQREREYGDYLIQHAGFYKLWGTPFSKTPMEKIQTYIVIMLILFASIYCYFRY